MPVTATDIPEIFSNDGWISDVEYLVSSGKEGTVFCCRGGDAIDAELVAVKIHRGRTTRSFKNDAIYLQGRAMGVSLNGAHGMKSSGMPDRRLERAVAKRSRRGIAAIEHSWINHEYNTMQVLYEAGARVPRPYAMSGHALVMEFLGDEEGPAPKLKHTHLERPEAVRLHTALLDEIRLWLANDRIHGDLSPFNILYWNGEAVVIDFPQAINPHDNPAALMLLERDVRTVCDHFAGYGIASDPERITRDFWQEFQWGMYVE